MQALLLIAPNMYYTSSKFRLTTTGLLSLPIVGRNLLRRDIGDLKEHVKKIMLSLPEFGPWWGFVGNDNDFVDVFNAQLGFGTDERMRDYNTNGRAFWELGCVFVFQVPLAAYL
jgi:hypothetical protein